MTDSTSFGGVLGSALVRTSSEQLNTNAELLGPLTNVLGSLSEHTKTNSSLLRELQQTVQKLAHRVDDRVSNPQIVKRLERCEKEFAEELPGSGGPQRDTAAAVEAALKVAVECVTRAVMPMERSLQRLEDSVQQSLQHVLDVQVVGNHGSSSGSALRAATSFGGTTAFLPPKVDMSSSDARADGHPEQPNVLVPKGESPVTFARHSVTAQAAAAGSISQNSRHLSRGSDNVDRRRETQSTAAPPPAAPAPAAHATSATPETYAPPFTPARRSVLKSSRSLEWIRSQNSADTARKTSWQRWQRTRLAVMHEDLQRMEDRCQSMSLSRRAWLYHVLGDWVSWLSLLEEPERTGFWANVVQSTYFETGVAVVISVNAIFTTADTNYGMRHLESSSLAFLEIIFTVFYAVELAARLQVHRWYFFVGPENLWNIFDFALVALAFYDIIFTVFLKLAGTAAASVAQSLRIMRIVRVLRLFRLVTLFSETRLMFNCVMGSLFNLVSSFMMLCLMFFLFALLIVQTLSIYLIENGGADPAARTEIDSIYGTVQLTMFTLYRSVFHGDDWDEYYQVLHERSLFCSVLFIFFIFLSQVCVVNVLTAIFVEKASQIHKPDTFTQMMNESMKQVQEAENLYSLCSRLDSDGSGTLTVQELLQHIRSKSVRAEFLALGLDLRNCEEFFELLLMNKSTNEVEIDTLVDGCMRMKGSATAMNQQAVLLEMRSMRHAQAEQNWREKHFQTEVKQMLDAVVSRLNLPPDRKA